MRVFVEPEADRVLWLHVRLLRALDQCQRRGFWCRISPKETSATVFVSIVESLRKEFTFEFPRLAIGIEYFSEPAKRIFCDFREGPPSWCSIRANAYLNDFLTAPTPDLVFPMIMNGVSPVDSPGLDRRIPHAECGPKHVLRLV